MSLSKCTDSKSESQPFAEDSELVKMIKATSQGTWYFEGLKQATQFAKECAKHDVRFVENVVQWLLNFDVINYTFPSRAFNKTTGQVEKVWKEMVDRGMEIVDAETEKLRAILTKEKEPILPFFQVLQFLHCPIESSPPPSFESVKTQMHNHFQQFQRFEQSDIISLLNFNLSRYSELYNPMVYRYEYVTCVRDTTDRKTRTEPKKHSELSEHQRLFRYIAAERPFVSAPDYLRLFVTHLIFSATQQRV